MNILYIGNYQAPWCTEVHIARELERLGHHVDRFQEPPGGGTSRTLDRIEHHAARRGTHLVLWTRTWGLPAEATAMWRRLEARGITTASYHLDLYYGLDRERNVTADPFWTTGWVFTPDGNPDAGAWFAGQGIAHRYMPPAVVSDECATVMPGRPRAEFDYDVVFVGSYGYHPEWPWRVELIDQLAATYGPRFRRFGGDTKPGPIRGQDLNDLYATAKVVVGDSCFAHRGQRYWSDRPYEAWGRGAFMVFPRIDALATQLGIIYPHFDAGDFAAVHQAVEQGLDDPQMRTSVQARLTATVADQHTYRHRLAEALTTMGLT